jgi:hypothetical protein
MKSVPYRRGAIVNPLQVNLFVNLFVDKRAGLGLF